MFLEAARINHSCLPNAHAAWNVSLGMLTVYATKIIDLNEEITINYCQYYKKEEAKFALAADREPELQKTWNFVCNCEACQRAARSDLVVRD